MVEALHGLGMTNAMITSSVITLFLCVGSIIASRNLQLIPGTFQNMIEMGLEKLHNFFSGVMGTHCCRRYFPIVATLFIYILCCNYSGLLPFAGIAPGFKPSTGVINFPAGMAIAVFCMVQIIGLRECGTRYFKKFFMPFAFLFPLLLLEQFTRPISLTLRLYGNIMGEEMVTETLFEMCPIGVPLVMQFLSVLLALIQALVFSLLAGIYIAEAAEREEIGLPEFED